jgi:hypothetical protein
MIWKVWVSKHVTHMYFCTYNMYVGISAMTAYYKTKKQLFIYILDIYILLRNSYLNLRPIQMFVILTNTIIKAM